MLAEPPLAEVGRLLAANRRRLRLDGRAWRPALGRSAAPGRQAAVAAAREYLSRRGEPVPNTVSDHLILAGHQPELFHPGVWVKNFALHGLARRHGLTPINLVVDNDTVKATALRLPPPPPCGSAHPHAVSEPFDRWTGEVPYEERAIVDPDLFAGFADGPRRVLRGWDFEPMLPAFWAEVLR